MIVNDFQITYVASQQRATIGVYLHYTLSYYSKNLPPEFEGKWGAERTLGSLCLPYHMRNTT